MRMLGASVDLELLEESATETVVGDHAANSFLHHELGTATTKGACVLNLLATHVTRVADILLHVLFVASEHSLLSIDNDNEVTGIDMSSEGRLVLSTKEAGSLFGDAAKGLALGIDHPPFAFDFVGFSGECFHVEQCDQLVPAGP